MSVYALLLTASLFAPPTTNEATAPPQGYEAALATVEQLDEQITTGQPVRGELFDALAELSKYHAELAHDPEARDLRTRARIDLARSYLADGDEASATGVVDELLRSTIQEELPIEKFGPTLAALYTEREAALREQGTAALEVQCAVPCQIYVNHRPTGQLVDNLYLGTYTVWIEATGPAADETYLEMINLSEPGEIASVSFTPAPPPKPKPLPKPLPKPPPERILPQAGEVAFMVVGVGLATAGGLLLGLNREKAVSWAALGGTLAGLGGVGLVVGGVTLTVDEVRLGKARGRQAMVTWTMKF